MADQSHWEEFEEQAKEWYENNVEDRIHRIGRTRYALLVDWYWPIRRFLLSAPFTVKMAVQRVTRGYSDDEIWGLDSAITKFVYPRIKEFTRWQSEHGHLTPFDFETDPAGWLEVLNKITRAFEVMAEEDFLLGEEGYPSVPEREKYGTEDEYERAIAFWREENQRRMEEVKVGLELFGKYYQNLWD